MADMRAGTQYATTSSPPLSIIATGHSEQSRHPSFMGSWAIRLSSSPGTVQAQFYNVTTGKSLVLMNRAYLGHEHAQNQPGARWEVVDMAMDKSVGRNSSRAFSASPWLLVDSNDVRLANGSEASDLPVQLEELDLTGSHVPPPGMRTYQNTGPLTPPPDLPALQQIYSVDSAGIHSQNTQQREMGSAGAVSALPPVQRATTQPGTPANISTVSHSISRRPVGSANARPVGLSKAAAAPQTPQYSHSYTIAPSVVSAQSFPGPAQSVSPTAQSTDRAVYYTPGQQVPVSPQAQQHVHVQGAQAQQHVHVHGAQAQWATNYPTAHQRQTMAPSPPPQHQPAHSQQRYTLPPTQHFLPPPPQQGVASNAPSSQRNDPRRQSHQLVSQTQQVVLRQPSVTTQPHVTTSYSNVGHVQQVASQPSTAFGGLAAGVTQPEHTPYHAIYQASSPLQHTPQQGNTPQAHPPRNNAPATAMVFQAPPPQAQAPTPMSTLTSSKKGSSGGLGLGLGKMKKLMKHPAMSHPAARYAMKLGTGLVIGGVLGASVDGLADVFSSGDPTGGGGIDTAFIATDSVVTTDSVTVVETDTIVDAGGGGGGEVDTTTSYTEIDTGGGVEGDTIITTASYTEIDTGATYAEVDTTQIATYTEVVSSGGYQYVEQDYTYVATDDVVAYDSTAVANQSVATADYVDTANCVDTSDYVAASSDHVADTPGTETDANAAYLAMQYRGQENALSLI